MSSYEEELDFVKESDDSLYPDFLFNPLFNDFEDNYYEIDYDGNVLLDKPIAPHY